MPTYEYLCSNCDHEWEAYQAISAKPLRKCPRCGKMKAERLISSGGGIIFKGSGFYQTDYRSESYKEGASADRKAQESSKSESSKTKSDSSSSTKSESRSAKKSTSNSD